MGIRKPKNKIVDDSKNPDPHAESREQVLTQLQNNSAFEKVVSLKTQSVDTDAVNAFVNQYNETMAFEGKEKQLQGYLETNYSELFQDGQLDMQSLLNANPEDMKEIANALVSLSGDINQQVLRESSEPVMGNLDKAPGTQRGEVMKQCGVALDELSAQKSSGISIDYDQDGDVSSLGM